jgi:hypothetical protein
LDLELIGLPGRGTVASGSENGATQPVAPLGGGIVDRLTHHKRRLEEQADADDVRSTPHARPKAVESCGVPESRGDVAVAGEVFTSNDLQRQQPAPVRRADDSQCVVSHRPGDSGDRRAMVVFRICWARVRVLVEKVVTAHIIDQAIVIIVEAVIGDFSRVGV